MPECQISNLKSQALEFGIWNLEFKTPRISHQAIPQPLNPHQHLHSSEIIQSVYLKQINQIHDIDKQRELCARWGMQVQFQIYGFFEL